MFGGLMEVMAVRRRVPLECASDGCKDGFLKIGELAVMEG
jgi:hypothetical protein